MLCVLLLGGFGLASAAGAEQARPATKSTAKARAARPKAAAPTPKATAPRPAAKLPAAARVPLDDMTVVGKAPPGTKFLPRVARPVATSVTSRSFTRKDLSGAQTFTVKLRATKRVKPALLDLLVDTLTISALPPAGGPASKVAAEAFWRSPAEELDGTRSEVQVKLFPNGSVKARDYSFSWPEVFQIARPGVLEVVESYTSLVVKKSGPKDDIGFVRQALHGGEPHRATGRVMCGSVPLPHVAVTAAGRRAQTGPDGRYSIDGPFGGTPGTVFVSFEADVPMTTTAGSPSAPIRIFDDAHHTRNERFDRTPTITGDDAVFPDVTVSDDCWIWQRSIEALRDYFTRLRVAPPAGGVFVKRWSEVYNSSGAGAHTFYNYVVLPTDTARLNRRATFFHEFGHSLRHVADGAQTHWDWDNTRFLYARVHNGTQVTNKGFVFNEGWATYWSAVVLRSPVSVAGGAPTDASFVAFNEDRVAERLMTLSSATSPTFMMGVLLANPGVIHTLEQFEQRYCARVGTTGNPHCRSGRPTRAFRSCPQGYNDDGLTCRLNNILSRPQTGRGVGTIPNGCPAGRELQNGLCYRRCDAGLDGDGPTCYRRCPAGYNDDGVTCHRVAHIFSSDNSGCPGYDICGLTFAQGCSVCPADYHNDGCTCRRDPHIFGQESRDRGVGTIPNSCTGGLVMDAGLCYRPCPSGMQAAGLFCYGSCPAGFANHGVTCYRDPNIFSDDPVIAP